MGDMKVAVAAGPGNGREMCEALMGIEGLKVVLAHEPADLAGADVVATPRGPSRSFSSWFDGDELGAAVLAAYQDGTPWLALCGSGIPLSSELGPGCNGIHARSIAAMKATNDRLFGQDTVKAADGRSFPFHFTSAPSFSALGDTDVLGETDGEGSVLRADDLVISSGLPMTLDGWRFLFEALGMPIGGAKADATTA